ncbi:MAG TPA: tRNA (adenosine(37)-N6)-dimethylallyltransferase MiaA, partial [Nitrospiria bacterium]|nr:tRNA (adenosine(37)-N6)-dimethylallyltransferase MiaA [Nitrospiria bacterium]
MKTRENRNTVIVLAGPTGVGKTGAAIWLAKRLGTEVLSADSRMVFRGMDIGTAKPTLEERQGVPHHLIDVADPDETFSAGRFRGEAIPILDRLLARGMVPIVVGGTGLYIKLLFRGLWTGPGADWNLRKALYREEEEGGPGTLHARLLKVDPESAGRIAPADQPKLVRAIEVFEKTGTPLSAHHRDHGFPEKSFDTLFLGLRRERPDLFKRIEKRVDRMVEMGLPGEVEGLIARGYSPDLPSMKGLGYRQMAGYLDGQYNFSEAVRILKKDTKRYAKRQFTWFNRDPDIRWVELAEGD